MVSSDQQKVITKISTY